MNGKYVTAPQPYFTADVIVSIILGFQSGGRVGFSKRKLEFVKSFDIGKKVLILVPFRVGIFRREGMNVLLAQDFASSDKQFPWVVFFNGTKLSKRFLRTPQIKPSGAICA